MSYSKTWVHNTSLSFGIPIAPIAIGGRGEVFIAGGDSNTMSGLCSSILGGRGNTVTHDFAAVFGNGIVSVAPNTFHAECLNAVNTPVVPPGGGIPSGTIVRWDPAAGPVPTGFLPLYIAP